MRDPTDSDRSTAGKRWLAWTTRGVVALLIVVIPAVALLWMTSTRPEVTAADPEQRRQAVVVMEMRPVEVQQQWRGYGVAEALRSADVPARVTATVVEIPEGILPGSRVMEGQVLAELDAADFVRQLEIARRRIDEIDAALAQIDVEEATLTQRLVIEDSDVAMAQAEYDRQVSLRERNVTNIQNVDAANRALLTARRSRLATREAIELIGPRRRSLQAQRASQEAQVNLAELSRQRATVTSPIEGVLQAVDVEVGESLTAGERVARVVALRRIEVPLALPGAARAGVRVGDRVTLRPTGGLPAMIGWEATVARIAPEQDAATRTITVFVELHQEGDELRLPVPGMFLEGTVRVSDRAPRLIVPRRAIRAGRVQLVEDGVVVSRAVEVMFTLSETHPELGVPDDQWAVLEGEVLREGDLLVVNAATRLADGTLVTPVRPDGSSVAVDAAPPAPAEAEPPDHTPTSEARP